MSEPFLAEIKIFAGNFAPPGYAFCDGQLLPIAQNTALFSLIGTTYGGDGETTTALPNLQGRAAMHAGRGPGLTSRRVGEKTGVNTVTLSEAQMPNHGHGPVRIQGQPGNRPNPENSVFATTVGANTYAPNGSGSLTTLDSSSVLNAGGSQAHNNLQPYTTLNFIIATVGQYPSRA